MRKQQEQCGAAVATARFCSIRVKRFGVLGAARSGGKLRSYQFCFLVNLPVVKNSFDR